MAIEGLGTQGTFESALRVLRPGGTLSSLGVHSGDLRVPTDAFLGGLADIKIVTTLCPGSKERMRRLIDILGSARTNLKALVTHRFSLDQIEDAYELFANQHDGVLKVAQRVADLPTENAELLHRSELAGAAIKDDGYA